MEPKSPQQLTFSLATETSVDSLLAHLKKSDDKYNDYEYPKVSIIVPVYNAAQSIELTLNSLVHQNYPDFEIIVIDAGSTDRTLEVVKSYHQPNIQVFTVSNYQRYEMLNRGISQAGGLYINFLFPGDFYISADTLKYAMTLALDHDNPELLFSGTLLRDGRSEVKILYRHLSVKLLRRGQQPTSLQSIWFRRDVFRELGKFNPRYGMRGGYEFLCRFALHKRLKTVSTNRVLTDYDLRLVTLGMVVRHFWETLITLLRYFGLGATLRWLFFYQKDTRRIVTLWWRNLRIAFTGK